MVTVKSGVREVSSPVDQVSSAFRGKQRVRATSAVFPAGVGYFDRPALLWRMATSGELAGDELRAAVPWVWTTSTTPLLMLDVSRWRELWRLVGGSDGCGVQPSMTLWRGATEAGRYGLSWSPDRAVAEVYARRGASRLWRVELPDDRALARVWRHELIADVRGLTVELEGTVTR